MVKSDNAVVGHLIVSLYISVAASDNGVFTSPQRAKSFDFTSEERIYNWYFNSYTESVTDVSSCIFHGNLFLFVLYHCFYFYVFLFISLLL